MTEPCKYCGKRKALVTCPACKGTGCSGEPGVKANECPRCEGHGGWVDCPDHPSNKRPSQKQRRAKRDK